MGLAARCCFASEEVTICLWWCHSDGAKFISACLLSLATLMRMDLPTVNVLSKIDLITTTSNTHHGTSIFLTNSVLPCWTLGLVHCVAAFDIDFYTDLSNISELLPTLPGFSGYSGELEGETEACVEWRCNTFLYRKGLCTLYSHALLVAPHRFLSQKTPLK